jgi:hypothetical protein
MEFAMISLSKAKNDVKMILEKIGVKVTEVALCTANVVYRKNTLAYIYKHEYQSVESALTKFVEEESKNETIEEFYLWSEYEGGNRYLNIGYFLKPKNGITKLVTFSVLVPTV